MGSLDRPQGSGARRKIALVDVTGKTATEIEDAYNDNFGLKGWRIIQVIDIGSSRFIIAEKEL
jgi:hypothetical protein